MIKSEKKLKDLAAILHKDNNILISEAILSLRNEQPFEGAIGLLTAHYSKTRDNTIKKMIEDFMNDLKDQAACVEVINEIRKDWNRDTTSMLISSCWQSGLDYSEYSLDMARVFLRGDYVTAIECLTVIEDSVNELSDGKKDEIARLIHEGHIESAKEKRELTFELLTILDREP